MMARGSSGTYGAGATPGPDGTGGTGGMGGTATGVAAGWFDLTGRVALVTGGGANGGNGHAIALGLARYGADLLVTDVDTDGAAQTAQEVAALGRRCAWVRADSGEPDDIAAVYAELDRTYGRIDILVNNVAASHRSRPEDLSLADWQRVIRIILDGTFLFSQQAGRRMIEAGRGGCIINISSIAASSALGRGNFVYSVAKGGINQLTRELAVEWSPHGIRVNGIQPCQILTPALKRILADPRLDPKTIKDRFLRGIPLGRLGDPDDVAKAAVFLASDAAAFITGVVLPVDGGNLALNAGGDRRWPETANVTPETEGVPAVAAVAAGPVAGGPVATDSGASTSVSAGRR
jgi:NAD(P)-dependent dehydrogenase (short-subunit alcohol dehydrogenase family)